MGADRAWIEAVPNKRFHPICHLCGIEATRIHSQEKRVFRDLNFASALVWIQCQYQKMTCPQYHQEISIRKGHRYLTVVLDYLTGGVLWVGKDRKARTLKKFFLAMTKEQRQGLEAMVMDMWDPYTLAVQQSVPPVRIVFDLFHVVAQFNRLIDKVRNIEYRKAIKTQKDVFKGTKYLLLKNRSNVRRDKEKTGNILRSF
jgi:transposase